MTLFFEPNLGFQLQAVEAVCDPCRGQPDSGAFAVEIETGTGKTYVYLRTIFELNKRCGFTKLIIVVPSIALKEGVCKSLQIPEERFRARYSETPFESCLYDSAKLGLGAQFRHPVRRFKSWR